MLQQLNHRVMTLPNLDAPHRGSLVPAPADAGPQAAIETTWDLRSANARKPVAEGVVQTQRPQAESRAFSRGPVAPPPSVDLKPGMPKDLQMQGPSPAQQVRYKSCCGQFYCLELEALLTWTVS